MILFDTNVISALMRPPVDPAVAAYFGAQPAAALFTSSVCEAEIRFGAHRLPIGRRRDSLLTAFRVLMVDAFAGRVIAFDSACASAYAEVRVRCEAAGRSIAIADAMIAATALAHGAILATRNISDFAACGIPVENPWDDPI
jgi:predicted nucleic acid-binding protein